MPLNPRYGDNPILALYGEPSAILAPLISQRRRLEVTLAAMAEADWAHPSRCDGWSCLDVLIHLESTNAFWTASITGGLKGTPTQFLESFDPVASPAALVDGARGVSADVVLAKFLASNEALFDVIEPLTSSEWSMLAEAPPGHVSISAVLHHALWDSWIHERDICLPLGLTPSSESDEVAACLMYAAALSGAAAASSGRPVEGMFRVRSENPEVQLVVEIGESVRLRQGDWFDEHREAGGIGVTVAETAAVFELAGDATELVEALSVRAPFPAAIPEETTWMLTGVARLFEAEEATHSLRGPG